MSLRPLPTTADGPGLWAAIDIVQVARLCTKLGGWRDLIFVSIKMKFAHLLRSQAYHATWLRLQLQTMYTDFAEMPRDLWLMTASSRQYDNFGYLGLNLEALTRCWM